MKFLLSSVISKSLRNQWLRCSVRRLRDENQKELDIRWNLPRGIDTGIVIYNPVTKRKVPLILKNKECATWYMCGPTVYDSAHIGHACSYVKLDIIRRILVNYFDINLVTMMGITDIDDKIIKRSIESRRDWKELTRFYEKEFFSDMAALNVERPYLSCRVSDYVPRIIEFILQILRNGGAYVAKEGSVYFDTTAYNGYGKLGVKEPNAPLVAGKRNGLDFALWKAAKPGEPFWESPWGPGRPGWHIECSVMASEKFGSNVDIHSGGIDLAFPHHENEEAQSCQRHGVSQWVNYWLHTGHLHANRMKMSKSLGNSTSVVELLAKYSADQFRLFCLMSHYRSGVEYTEQSMDASIAILKKIESFLDDCDNYVNGAFPGKIDEVVLSQRLVETKSVVRAALENDFDTPKAIRTITSLVALGNKMLHLPCEQGIPRSPAIVAALANYITSTLKSFGMKTKTKNTLWSGEEGTADVINDFVKFRSYVRNFAVEVKSKDTRLLEACDKARKSLAVHGVQIKDHGSDSTWSFRGANKP